VKRPVVPTAAKSDLAAIRAYSQWRRGREQAGRYIGLNVARFAWLMRNASRGARQDFIATGLRRINARRHAIFYVEGDDTVEIARVPHQQMDQAQQFRAVPDDEH
jgi:toxin ParE1/3/4